MKHILLLAALALTAPLATSAATTPAGVATPAETTGFRTMTFTVDGVERTALVYAPASAKTKPSPLVFIFHGHGGSAAQVARSYEMNRQWPEAIAVHMQGLPTVGQLTDPDGAKAGWQAAAGDGKDRDIRFFDAVLAKMKTEYAVDAKRVYCTGHSNGGGFTYLLWYARPDVFAAVAPSAAVARYGAKLTAKPAMMIGGTADPLVKFEWQKRMMETVRQIDGCADAGVTWNKLATLYPSKSGNPVVTLVHTGGHTFDKDAPALMVKFFKEHPEEKK